MEIRQLEALVGIAEHGTFSSAAEALGTVQSNISNRIARLESELGSELIDRASGALTESGAVVVERARRILSEVSAIAADVSELTADIRGRVSMGMIGTAGRWIVPLLLEGPTRDVPAHLAAYHRRDQFGHRAPIGVWCTRPRRAGLARGRARTLRSRSLQRRSGVDRREDPSARRAHVGDVRRHRTLRDPVALPGYADSPRDRRRLARSRHRTCVRSSNSTGCARSPH